MNGIKYILSQCLQNNKNACFFFFLWGTVVGVNILFYIVEMFNFLLKKSFLYEMI